MTSGRELLLRLKGESVRSSGFGLEGRRGESGKRECTLSEGRQEVGGRIDSCL